MSSQRESVTVLEECIDLQKRKSQDYQNPNSNIVQSMHYRRGVSTIHDMVHQKLLRAQSLLEPIENGNLSEPNFESLEDTYKDAINYLSFAVSYLRGKMEGQDPNRDMLNRAVIHEGLGQINNGVVDAEMAPIAAPRTTESYVFEEQAEERVRSVYHEKVKPVGMITAPVDEPLVNDPLMATYMTKVKDVGDRIDETFESK